MKWRILFVFIASTAALTAQLEVLTSFDYPDATFTEVGGVNDAGDIVGRYGDASVGPRLPPEQGKFTNIDFPGCTDLSPDDQRPGRGVGYYNDRTTGHLPLGRASSLRSTVQQIRRSV
jgi:hypothetical protein